MKRLLFLLLLLPVVTHGQIITTIAGNGSYFTPGDDGGPATAAGVLPRGCAVDKDGNLFFTDYSSHRIRKVSTSGIITTIAGIGTSGYNGDGIPATDAQLYGPGDIAVDVNGNIYFADALNVRVRRIDAVTQIITTVAGNGGYCDYVDGTNVTSSCIGMISCMCMDKQGNIYISNSVKVGKISPSGIINVIAGQGGYSLSWPFLFTPQPATSLSLQHIQAITVDTADNLYLKLTFTPDHQRTTYAAIFRVDPAGTLTRYAGNGYNGYTGDGGMATDAKIYCTTGGITTDTKGNLYFSAAEGVRRVDKAGTICTVAGNGTAGFSGDGSVATAAQLDHPDGIASYASGDIIIADYSNNRIRKVTQPSCGYITGINTIEKKQFSMYPNPVTTELNIDASHSISSICIYNLLGQIVFSRNMSANKAQVDVSDLPDGVYLVRVNGSEVRRFVKK